MVGRRSEGSGARRTSSHGLRLRALALGLLAGLALGCEAELARDLSATQADEIVLALDEASILATREPARPPGSFRVTVARGEVVGALRVLRERGLPREPVAGLEELRAGGGLIERPEAERARYAAALAGELTRSLEAIDGVERARVHLALAPPSGAPLDAPVPPSRASVLLQERGRAAIDDDAIRALVAGAVPDLPAGAVSVVRSPLADAAPPERAFAPVGPFAVRRDDATPMRLVLAASFALNLLLAVAIVAVLRRRARQPAPPTHEP